MYLISSFLFEFRFYRFKDKRFFETHQGMSYDEEEKLQQRMENEENSSEKNLLGSMSPRHFALVEQAALTDDQSLNDDDDWTLYTNQHSMELLGESSEKKNSAKCELDKIEDERGAWSLEEKKVLSIKRKEIASEMRKLNLIESGILPFSEITRRLKRPSPSQLPSSRTRYQVDEMLPPQSDSEQEDDILLEFSPRKGRSFPDKDEGRTNDHHRTSIILSFDHWRQFSIYRLKIKRIYIILANLHDAHRYKGCAKTLLTWKEYARMVGHIKEEKERQVKKKEDKKKQLLKKEKGKKMISRIINMHYKKHCFTEWIHQCVLKKQLSQFEIKRAKQKIKSVFILWMKWKNKALKRKTIMFRKLVLLTRRRMRMAWTQWLLCSKILAQKDMSQIETSLRTSELESSIDNLSSQLHISAQQLAESDRQLRDAKALLYCEENKEK